MGIRDLFAKKEPTPPPEVELHALVYGKVQGVGFRWWAVGVAKPLNLVGYAKNLEDGSVEIVAQGTRVACQEMLASLMSGDTAGRVDHVDHRLIAPRRSYLHFGMY